MTNKDWLFFNSRDDLLRIDMAEIMYFEADGNYTNIVLSNRTKCTVGMSLGKMEQILSERLRGKVMYFARIGKSYIINLNMVFQINVLKHRLVLSDFHQGTFTLEVSKDALKRVKELIIQVKI
ncbi:MAG: LytTR family transcriptional regulator [Prevotella sp.]|nr:LytTR family transcriptional regulator [Prevotella sp.]